MGGAKGGAPLYKERARTGAHESVERSQFGEESVGTGARVSSERGGSESSVLCFESSVLGFECSVLGPEDGSVLGTRRTLCSLPSSPPPSPRRGLLGLLLLSRLPRGPLRRHGRGDAAATVVRRTRAFGRGVPERVCGHGRSRGQA